jgi:hypothetical protein
VAALSCSVCHQPVAADDVICPMCGWNLAASPRVGGEAVPPPEARPEPGAGPAAESVVLEFPFGVRRVPAGSRLNLGRDPAWSPLAGRLETFDSVSRVHASLLVDRSGEAWVRDERSMNGTFLNGHRIDCGVDVPVASGDVIRLASTVTIAVRSGA